ncbi:MAG: hypothetical protein ACREFR_03000, partial [Limisphaerales bacterium]
ARIEAGQKEAEKQRKRTAELDEIKRDFFALFGEANPYKDGQMKTSHFERGIAQLAANGWSSRKIARERGLDRETVRRYRSVADSKPAISPTGSGEDSDSKPANVPTIQSRPRQSMCPVFISH